MRHGGLCVIAVFIAFVAGCIPLRIGDAPGAFGQLVSSGTGQPVSGGRVCLVNEPQNCTISTQDGRFRLPPRTHEVWTFIMFEDFPKEYSLRKQRVSSELSLKQTFYDQ